ncbi:MAG: HPr(Ser) kinase/phosphatase [Lachnospiraceae bacterium]|nr:HPr(Ser) kinase/phosphatase [Lachnospiraceae bacterium]
MCSYQVSLVKMAEKMNLVNLTPEIDISKRIITKPEINRPALQLAGFFSDFDAERIQLIGNVEYAYMYKNEMTSEERHICFSRLMGYGVPCIIFCRNLNVSDGMRKLALEKGVPVFQSSMETTALVAELVRWLKVQLAPRISIHGVLVDVFGEGLLIMGESGIGKSEAALELIRRGHRLVADDVVEIRRITDKSLIGTAPPMTQYFLEVRGIGIIDVKNLFGVESIMSKQSIDLVIKLEEWTKEAEYDRLGMEEEHVNFLGLDVVCQSIPIRPGRNLAVICEVAAANHRQKKMGYNAAKELYRRVEENMSRKAAEKGKENS